MIIAVTVRFCVESALAQGGENLWWRLLAEPYVRW
ncbi:MAG: hypothetical protein ACJA0B_001634 [Alcanivorax borkumensis]|jgi:hypothetical protein